MDPQPPEAEPEIVDELARQRLKRQAASAGAAVSDDAPPAPPETPDGGDPAVVSTRLEELSTALRRYQAVAELEAMLLKD